MIRSHLSPLSILIFLFPLFANSPCYAGKYTIRIPDLEAQYGGVEGIYLLESSFDFRQHFLTINSVQLNIKGNYPHGTTKPVDIHFRGVLDNDKSSPQITVGVIDDFEFTVPLALTGDLLDGNGTIQLYVGIDSCCDKIVHITEVNLVYGGTNDGPPIPTASQWGLCCLTLLLVISGSLIIRNH